MTYYWLRQLHITTVAFTIAFFTLRFYWMLVNPRMVATTWVRIVSVVNDSLLLLAGISMALISRQYPFAAPWLTAKFLALLLYILLGTLALRRGRSRNSRILYGAMALLCVSYIVSVALTRSVLPLPSLTF